MTKIYEFDETKYRLGNVCKRGHIYEDSGMSLRRLDEGSCIICRRAISKKWQRKNSNTSMYENKACNSYLGVVVAEQVLSNVFKDVTKMDYGYPGFDFICNRGKKIDVKSATTMKDRNGWLFTINKNTIADYFLCLAFDNRDDLNPLHIWLLPSNMINDKVGVGHFTINTQEVERVCIEYRQSGQLL